MARNNDYTVIGNDKSLLFLCVGSCFYYTFFTLCLVSTNSLRSWQLLRWRVYFGCILWTCNYFPRLCMISFSSVRCIFVVTNRLGVYAFFKSKIQCLRTGSSCLACSLDLAKTTPGARWDFGVPPPKKKSLSYTELRPA